MGVLVVMVGAKCTNCVEDETAMARVMIAAGVAIITRAMAVSSSTQLVHLAPTMTTSTPMMPTTIEMTVRARAACRSELRASMESYTCPNSIIMEFYSPITPEAQKREIGGALYLGWATAAFLLIGGASCAVVAPHSLRRGWIIAIVSCTLPMWRVTAFISSNIVTAQIIWEGLWMTCVVQSTSQMQCKVYDSMLALSQDLQAARALTVISILLAILAVLITIAGAKCTNCIEDEASKAKVMIISGVFFIVSGFMQLIPVSWLANTIIRDFYNPLLTDAQRRELGAALYIGWGASALMILSGSLLCCSCPPRKYNPSRIAYSAPRSAPGGPGFERKYYV
ncbi:unnamed protein product [Coregonus sp. 'balchen']|nr:unnamed protein product [Coregonus sp. 'balchen']